MRLRKTVSVATGTSLRGLRLELAIAFSGGRRTLYEAATAVGRKSGGIQKTVHKMHADEWLLADSEEITQGTQLWLDPNRLDELEAAVALAQPPGALIAGQRTLKVSASDRVGLYTVLARAELSTPVIWAVELDGAGTMLLVLDRETGLLHAERLQAALRAAGVECEAGRIGDRIEGRVLRQHAIAVMTAAQ